MMRSREIDQEVDVISVRGVWHVRCGWLRSPLFLIREEDDTGMI